MERADREKKTYDNDELDSSWRDRFSHVFNCRNTNKAEIFLMELLKEYAKDKIVLDIGCGEGDMSKKIYSFGAKSVYGIDVSSRLVEIAKKNALNQRLSFEVKDIQKDMEGKYDLIFGRAVLHHVDYKLVLKKLYDNNLSKEGIMVFYEPLAGNIFIKLYHLFAKSAHTADEKPFLRRDLVWLKKEYPNTRIEYVNLFSFVFGMISSLLFKTADNILMNSCDKIDRFIAKKMNIFGSSFRAAIIVITKQ